ncbi:MAG: succinylglutamate desuccinylase [Atribacterota bacterium]|nr:succinylglutamate desuccinylase [Atribacterota bacterium]MDD4289114.1 succinylglutamate desuccinylase [Atribacterota bacterium]MDD5635281.1 succinylglutamate desuccinylase [Atribacterota bacterium]
MIETRKIKIIMLTLVAIITVIAGIQLYQHRHYDVPIVAGPGVTKVGKLSDYYEGIKGTVADTNVFFMEGEQEGGSMLVIANTHSNEIVAGLTAFMIVENAVVEKGRLIVIPQFNNSGGRNTRAGDGYPLYFDIDTPWGSKTFRMGNRDASPLDQWPDPDVYVHYPEGQLLSYMDVRNTNRTWPGRPDGPLMEQVCYAAMELIRNENIDATLDVHGAETLFPVTNCIVAPDKSMRIATMTSLTVKSKEGFDFHVEPSPSGMRGLSHREIGDYSDSMPFLVEAPLPFLDQPTGPKTMDLLLTGRDPFLLSLSKKGMLFVPYDEEGWPIERRAGQHTSVVLELMNQMARQYPEKEIVVSGIPKYKDVVENGIGYYLTDPSTVDESRIYYE